MSSRKLKQLSGDAGQLKAIRTEAAYHLVSLAADAGKADEVKNYLEQLMQIDPASPWTQRAAALRLGLPATAEKEKEAGGSDVPTISLKPGGK